MQHNENTEEWMDRFITATIECSYKEIDRPLKEQFIHELNDDHIMIEIIKELTTSEENKDVTSYQVLLWAR